MTRSFDPLIMYVKSGFLSVLLSFPYDMDIAGAVGLYIVRVIFFYYYFGVLMASVFMS